MKKIVFSTLLFLSSILVANSLDEIKSSKVIRVGIDIDSPPFSSSIDGQIEGFEIDFAKQIAQRIFKNGEGAVEFINIENEDQAINFLQNNKVDIAVASLEVNDYASKLIDFSMPYFSVNIAALNRTDNKVTKISDLLEKNILLIHDTHAEFFAKEKGYNIVYCHSHANCYQMLKSGKGDVVLDQNIVLLAFSVLDRNVEVGINSISTSDFLAIGVKKGNKELLDSLNQILIELSKEGFFKDTFKNRFDPFYKGHADQKYFLLDDIYRIFG